jgi:RNA polymerase sigma-70 factor (ECF subfamily)
MNSAEQFEALVSEYYEQLYRFAISLTGAEPDAKDLTQQTFYIWATKGHQLRDATKVKSWLFTTLHRTFLLARRNQARFSHHALEEIPEELPTVAPIHADQMDSSQVLLALAKVDEIFRPALTLFYLEDSSYKDIAAILEVPVGTVKSRIARGIAQLRQILLLEGNVPEGAGSERDLSTSPVEEPVSGFRILNRSLPRLAAAFTEKTKFA